MRDQDATNKQYRLIRSIEERSELTFFGDSYGDAEYFIGTYGPMYGVTPLLAQQERIRFIERYTIFTFKGETCDDAYLFIGKYLHTAHMMKGMRIGSRGKSYKRSRARKTHHVV